MITINQDIQDKYPTFSKNIGVVSKLISHKSYLQSLKGWEEDIAGDIIIELYNRGFTFNSNEDPFSKDEYWKVFDKIIYKYKKMLSLNFKSEKDYELKLTKKQVDKLINILGIKKVIAIMKFNLKYSKKEITKIYGLSEWKYRKAKKEDKKLTFQEEEIIKEIIMKDSK